MVAKLFNKPLSLQHRIFISMVLFTLLSSVLIVLVSIYQYNEQAKDYNKERLERKESSIKEHINYVLLHANIELTDANISTIFNDKITEISDIHGLEINFFNLNGKLIISSKAFFLNEAAKPQLAPNILNDLDKSIEKHINTTYEKDGLTYTSSYSYMYDNLNRPVGIINIPYPEKSDFYNEELYEFLERIIQAYAFLLLLSVAIAYFLARYITKNLHIISQKIKEIELTQTNQKIIVHKPTSEIKLVIDAYNTMVDKLEESAVLLAQTERETAWREMAKQVAHEIKNPLTPMRLTIQSFQRRFNPNDPEIHQKINEYSETLIQQIDTMSAVASAFSAFASMPAQQNETVEIVEAIQLALDIFSEDFIEYKPQIPEISTKIDRTQLIRIITNLVKNSLQALPENKKDKKIIVSVEENNKQAIIKVMDNGIGITNEQKNHIFEPKFTTKTSGMGLGLAIIKNIIENYNGTITFESEPTIQTTFIVTLPIL